jgi:hypothetical protein
VLLLLLRRAKLKHPRTGDAQGGDVLPRQEEVLAVAILRAKPIVLPQASRYADAGVLRPDLQQDATSAKRAGCDSKPYTSPRSEPM